MWKEIVRIMNEAAVEGISQSRAGYNPKDEDFYNALRHSNEVFSTFKVHTFGVEMASKIFDSKGNLRSFDEWTKATMGIASHQVGSWLETEYNTAIIRAHQAADWREFERNKDIFPNLRWMMTTSPEPEDTHKHYWMTGLTLPIDDPFWNKHYPGDRWNCKCSLEATADPVVRPADIKEEKPQRGLDTNPGKTGELISSSHPYFPSKCSKCFLNKNHAKFGLKNAINYLFENTEDPNCHYCRIYNDANGLRKVQINKAKQHFNELKERINEFNGYDVVNENMRSGKLKVLRRTLNDILKHQNEDMNLMRWLEKFDLDDLGNMKYLGWAENRPYSPSHKKFDPKNPNKKKHPETEFFRYYSININGETYYANVKIHKNYNLSEVLYTIEKKYPDDVILEEK